MSLADLAFAELALLRELVAAIEAGTPVALATVVHTARSVPRHAGAKMLVFHNGRQLGTVGGELEARVMQAARSSLTTGETQRLDIGLVDPSLGDAGVCGGSVEVYVEPYLPRPSVVVVGCGHVGRAVIELSSWLGYRVVAIDDREDVATVDKLPGVDLALAGNIEDVFSKAAIDSRSHIVFVTRNVQVDVACLPAALASEAKSVGVMGSDRRWNTTREKLLDAEIAVSVLAQLVADQRSRPAQGDE